MKYTKTMFQTAAACILLGVSGVALAADCADGVIVDRIVENITVNGQSCIIVGVKVRGRVSVENSPAIVMIENDVDSRIVIKNSTVAAVVNNKIAKGDLKIVRSDLVSVKDNDVNTTIQIDDNAVATVTRNEAGLDIVCEGNGSLDSFLNRARGEDLCRGLFE